MIDRHQLSELWHSRAKLSRADIFGSADDALRPAAVPEQVDVCMPGMLGRTYDGGGVVIVSVNPAGGRDGFKPTPGDARLYQAMAEFRKTGQLHELNQLSRAYEIGMPTWGPQWRIIKSIIESIKISLSDIAYPYLVPFRSRGDAGSKLPRDVLDRGYELGFLEIMAALLPSCVIPVDRPSEWACLKARETIGARWDVVYLTRKRDAHAERAETLAKLSSGKAGGREAA